MEGEADDFAVVCEIYSHLTEKNKEKLIMIADSLLESQKDDTETAVGETAAFVICEKKGV